jgi:hypothetical protein
MKTRIHVTFQYWNNSCIMADNVDPSALVKPQTWNDLFFCPGPAFLAACLFGKPTCTIDLHIQDSSMICTSTFLWLKSIVIYQGDCSKDLIMHLDFQIRRKFSAVWLWLSKVQIIVFQTHLEMIAISCCCRIVNFNILWLMWRFFIRRGGFLLYPDLISDVISVLNYHESTKVLEQIFKSFIQCIWSNFLIIDV